MPLATLLRWLVPIVLTAAYGFVVRALALGETPLGAFTGWAMGLLGVAFLLVLPVVMGFVAARWVPATTLLGRLSASLVPITLLVIVTVLLRIEGAICVFLAAPPFVLLSLIGGALAHAVRERATRRDTLPALILPFLVAPIEGAIPAPDSTRVVASAIDVEASPEIVWSQIERVPAIARDELRPSLAMRLGFPAPVEATLDREGVGGVRRATFEGGVLFLETITEWDEPRVLSFAIDAQTETIPPTTLDEHVTIGGPFFDVLQGTYRIEPLAPGPDGRARVRLHLESRLRVSTHLNVYANPWVDALMASIQDQILLVVKNRSEAAARATSR